MYEHETAQSYLNDGKVTPSGRLTKKVTSISDLQIEIYLKSQEISRLSVRAADLGLTAAFTQKFTSWISKTKLNSVAGLELFLNRNVTHGVSQSIEGFLLRYRHARIVSYLGEYPYAFYLAESLGIEYAFIKTPDDLREGDALILSAPFSATGNVHPLMNETLKTASRLEVATFLDLAYWGCCRGMDLDFTATTIDTISFSLSKTFGVSDWRIGLEFSRDPFCAASILQRWDYLPEVSIALGLGLMNEFSADYIPEKYFSSAEAVCSALDLKTTSVVMLAQGDSNYEEFNRYGVANRVCISDAIANQTRKHNE